MSVHAANANGAFVDEEKEMIADYCREMGVESFDMDNIDSLDNLVGIFSESSYRVKKIVLLETLGLLYSDGVFDDTEKGFINEYAKKITTDLNKAIEWDEKITKKVQ